MTHIILYYNFTRVSEPETFCRQHKVLCGELHLLGRVYISQEGVNGTLAGDPDAIERYKQWLCSVQGFEDTAFKQDASETMPFERLVVKVRPEIVSLKYAGTIDPKTQGGGYLEPNQWRQALESGEDYLLIDVRNNYESEIGHFKGAIRPDKKNFYDFPEWVDEAGMDKDKKVLMYCTGGIRCEKFSVVMKEKGFKNVYQLHGGIIRYAQEEGGKHFKGKCFVFDDRLVVPVNPEETDPISHCEITGVPCDQYLNCANMECNRLFICSEDGARRMEGCCSEACRQHPRRRPLDPEHVYKPFRRWYQYFEAKP